MTWCTNWYCSQVWIMPPLPGRDAQRGWVVGGGLWGCPRAHGVPTTCEGLVFAQLGEATPSQPFPLLLLEPPALAQTAGTEMECLATQPCPSGQQLVLALHPATGHSDPHPPPTCIPYPISQVRTQSAPAPRPKHVLVSPFDPYGSSSPRAPALPVG